MADFISNSAILPTIRLNAVLMTTPNSGPRREEMADLCVKSAIFFH